MTSKAKLKRLCVQNPIGMATRVRELERERDELKATLDNLTAAAVFCLACDEARGVSQFAPSAAMTKPHFVSSVKKAQGLLVRIPAGFDCLEGVCE